MMKLFACRFLCVIVSVVFIVGLCATAQASDDFLIMPEEQYGTLISLLNDYLGQPKNSPLDINSIRDQLQEVRGRYNNGLGFFLYASIMADIENGNYASAELSYTTLSDRTNFGEFHELLQSDEFVSSYGAIRSVEALGNYLNGRREESTKNYAEAARYYYQCLSFYDGYERYSDMMSKPMPTPTITATPTIPTDSPKPVSETPEYLSPTTPTPPPIERETLKKGDSSDEVWYLQIGLVEKNYLYDMADASFGENTKNAVKALQKHAGLKETGIADPKTRAALWQDGGVNFVPQGDANLLFFTVGKVGDVAQVLFKNIGVQEVISCTYTIEQCKTAKITLGDLFGNPNSITSLTCDHHIKSGEIWRSEFYLTESNQISDPSGNKRNIKFFPTAELIRVALTEFTTIDGNSHSVNGRPLYISIYNRWEE